ncbi:hypothetical protein LCGC14_1832700 [marine sediment metagenome]|uniref:Uncharacterized protein n=1 Tax=marine sediment metagenome TaxID=412755 RepID=A0A0F9GFS4_9ZZZZ
MTSQPQITPDDLAAKWSNLLNQAFIQIITLEKQLATQAAFIQEMKANETAIVENIQALESELAELKSSPSPHTFSQAATELAAEGSAIIADEKEKAAPTEAA